MDFNDLTPEQKERARACETAEELIALAEEEGVELTDAQLEAVSGGSWNKCSDYCRTKNCSIYDCVTII